MKRSTIFKIAISSILIALLFYKIGLMKIISTLSTFNIQYIALAVLFLVLNHFSAITNLKIVISPIKKIRYPLLSKIYFASYSLGMISPGRVGEFSIAYFLKKEGLTVGQGVAISLLDKMITFFCLSIIAIIAFYTLFPAFNIMILIVLMICLFSGFALFLISDRMRLLVRKYVLRKYSKHMKGFSSYFKLILIRRPQILILNILMTFIKWAFAVMILYVIFLGFGVEVRFIDVYLITSIVSLTSLIPITINGIGLKESLSVILYSLVGISSTVVLSSYIISHLVQYLFMILAVLSIKFRVR